MSDTPAPIDRHPYHGWNPYVHLIYEDPLSVRLAAYDLDGTLRATIADPLELTYYDRYGDTPTLSVAWSSHVASHRALQGPCYVVLEYRVTYRADEHAEAWQPEWHEYRNSRFISAGQEWDRRDPTGRVRSSFTGAVSLLTGSRVWVNDLDEETGTRHFKNTSAGAIMLALITEAKARGEIPQIDAGFDATHDSFGQPWPTTISRELSPSSDLRSVLMDLHDSGEIEYWFDGFTLHMAKRGSWEQHFNNDFYRSWIRDTVVPTSDESRTWTEAFDRVLLLGDRGYRMEVSAPTSTPYGSRALVIDAGGVTDDATAAPIIEKALTESSMDHHQYSRTWTYVDDATTPEVPLRNFSPGDIIFMDTAEGRRQRVRVQEVSLSLQSDGSISLGCAVGTIRRDRVAKLLGTVRAEAKDAKKKATGGRERSSLVSHPGQKKSGLAATDQGISVHRPTADGSGTRTLQVSPDGTVEVVGLYRSGRYPERPYIEIDDSRQNPHAGNSTTTGIRFATRPAYMAEERYEPYIYAHAPGSDGQGGRYLHLQGGYRDSDAYAGSGGGPGRITLGGGNVDITGTTASIAAEDAQMIAEGLAEMVSGTARTDGQRSEVRAGGGGASAAMGVYKRTPGTSTTTTLGAVSVAGTMVTLAGGMLRAPVIQESTTAGAAVSVLPDLGLDVVAKASSRGVNKRFQRPVPLEAAQAVLDLTPLTWVDAAILQADPDTARREVGYTVEDVAETSAAHGGVLEPVIIRDGDGTPSSLAYERLPDAYTATLIRDLVARVEALEAEIAALRGSA